MRAAEHGDLTLPFHLSPVTAVEAPGTFEREVNHVLESVRSLVHVLNDTRPVRWLLFRQGAFRHPRNALDLLCRRQQDCAKVACTSRLSTVRHPFRVYYKNALEYCPFDGLTMQIHQFEF